MSVEKLFGELYREDIVVKPREQIPHAEVKKKRGLRLRIPHISKWFILFVVIVFGVFYLMRLGYRTIPRSFPLQIAAVKPLGQNTLASYTLSEKPSFSVKKPKVNPFLGMLVRAVSGHAGNGFTVTLQTPRKNLVTFRVPESVIASESKGKSFLVKKAYADEEKSQEPEQIAVQVDGDTVSVGLPDLDAMQSQPRGRYAMDVTWQNDGIVYNSVYAFSWGVLVMNTDKDTYETGDRVKVGVGMVDDRGYTICQGDITATITDPEGKRVSLRTAQSKESSGRSGEDSKTGTSKLTEEQAATLAFVTGGDSSFIALGSECADHSITDNPDYSFQFTVPMTGKYVIDLSATTEHGVEHVAQTITVVSSNDLTIARYGAMRIYPLADYTMRISLLSKNGYSGSVIETVPIEFGVTCEACEIAEKGKQKTLTWNVNLSPGVVRELSYTYNPPDISPALFVTGPLRIGERKEDRVWAIAFDAVVPQVTLTQRHYIFEDDDGATVNSNTDMATADTAITSIKKGQRINARFQVDNTSANTFFNPRFEIFYDRNDNIWTRVGASGSAAVVPNTGNCTDTNFNCGVVDSTSSDGHYGNKVAIAPDGTPWISYFDNNNNDLKVAKFVGSGGNCGGSGGAWSCSTIDSIQADGGYAANIAFTASGSAVVAYVDFEGANNYVRFAQFLGSGGNCTDTAWSCMNVDKIAITVGQNATPGIKVDPSDVIWISYSNNSSQLAVAKFVGTGGSGCSTGVVKFTCTAVDSSAVIYYTDIAIDASGNPWVSYQNHTTTTMKVAKYVGSGGSCSSTAWSCSVVDSTANSVLTQIAFDPSGNPWVSYQDGTNTTLRLARYVGSGGNCTDTAWNCGTVDSTAVSVGAYTGIAFDPTGNAWIVYEDLTNTSLKAARIKRGGEIVVENGLSGSNGDSLRATAAGSCTGGTTFVTGVWTQDVNLASSSASLGNLASNKCTEISFMINTSGAVAGTTYRLRLHNFSPGYDMGLNTYSQDPTLTVVDTAHDTIRSSKDVQLSMANCTDTTWGCSNITSSSQNLIMQQNSIAFDASGSAWISSFDNWNGDLVVSHYVGSGGSGCGTGVTAWFCQTVDHNASNPKGEMNSIGVDPKGKVWVAYYDRVNGDLEVAEYVGSGGSGCKAGVTDWLCYDIDSTGDTGGYTSIAFDANGNPWISNFGVNQTTKLAKYVGSGGTGCAISSWTCYIVDAATAGMGRYTTLKFDRNGDPWISYTDQSGANAIRIAQYIGSGGGSAAGCGAGSSTEWQCETIDDQVDTLGQAETQMAIDNNNVPWVAYHDLTAGDLWVAKYVGTGGSGCTSTYPGKWSCTKIDATDSVGLYLSIAIGPDNKPWIVYYDATSTSLMLARYVGGGAGGTGCGGVSQTDWTCTQIDNTATTTGQWPSIGFDPSGVPWVAETDATAANTELHVAKLHLPYFNNQIRYNLDDLGYTAVGTDDNTYDPMAATTNIPIYRFSDMFSNNLSLPTARWKGKSTIAASTNNILLQVYRGGSTNAWETLTTNSSCAANAGCTIIGTPSGTLSEYFTQDPASSNYWADFRVYQVAGTFKTLSSGYFNAAVVPTKIVYTTGSRSVTSGVCSGASLPFTIAMQDATGTSTTPTGTTVVQITSDSTSYAIYSDSGCSSQISSGNITFTTADSSQTFYLVDNVRGSHLLTATATSGSDILTAGKQYENTISTNSDYDSSNVTGGANIRGGTKLR